MAILLGTPAAAQNGPVRHALLIGIDRYASQPEGVQTLRYARKDAEALESILKQQQYETVTLVNEDAERDKIVRELGRYQAIVRPEDSFLLYFAGHGVLSERMNKNTYWLTYDAQLGLLDVGGIRLNHLLDYINDIPARKKLLILDHCHSGSVVTNLEGNDVSRARSGLGSLRAVRSLFPMDTFSRNVEEVADGLVVLGAAREEAYEFEDLGHGLFTYLLIEAMTTDKYDIDGNANLDVDELRRVVRDHVKNFAASKGASQEAIEMVRGTNLNWEIASITGTTAQIEADAERISDLVVDLEARDAIKFNAKIACMNAIYEWAEAKKRHQAAPPVASDIVDELRKLASLGANVSDAVKGQTIEATLRRLGRL